MSNRIQTRQRASFCSHFSSGERGETTGCSSHSLPLGSCVCLSRNLHLLITLTHKVKRIRPAGGRTDPSNTHTHAYTDIATINADTPHTHTPTRRFLFAITQEKLTRSASEQASECVINLFSLAPRSHGRGLIRGGELFCGEQNIGRKTEIHLQEAQHFPFCFFSPTTRIKRGQRRSIHHGFNSSPSS